MEPNGSSGRRRLLKSIAAAALTAGAAAFTNIDVLVAYAGENRPDRFGRLFPHLPPFAEVSDSVVQALLEMGRPSGMMDAKDALERGPADLITDPALSAHNPNNPTHTAGTTFFGQFMDHDMTFDTGSPLGKPADPQRSPNGRTPSFDLDSVYGAGPVGSPQLYDPTDRAKLKVESSGLFEDLPRMTDGTAIIADPRNDENVIISGLQAAFLLFHNAVVDRLRAGGTADLLDLYTQARRLT